MNIFLNKNYFDTTNQPVTMEIFIYVTEQCCTKI
jgi:hypothetical protein